MGYDVIIVGGGIGGSYAALSLDPSLSILILTKDGFEESNTYLAQGGIAAVVDPADRRRWHVRDTLTAGAGICDVRAVKTVVALAEENIHILHELGVEFDTEKGTFALTREGGHSRHRILHIDGDATGRGLVEALVPEVRRRRNIMVEQGFCLDLTMERDRVTGVSLLTPDGRICRLPASAVVLATGGTGQVYLNTTNSRCATGDGIAMASRAGAEVIHMEFIQFHPTVFHGDGRSGFLISEAVRGEGAVLRNHSGDRFMEGQHPLGELAPRDIVSRAMVREMRREHMDHLFLDATGIDREHLLKRFPHIHALCLEKGFDLGRDLVPVAPAQHYCIGGIRTDTRGRSSLPGLYACGEASCTGVHGANRLASNSLLEAVVVGKRIADDISRRVDPGKNSGEDCRTADTADTDTSLIRRELKETMERFAGVVRTPGGLRRAGMILDGLDGALNRIPGVSREKMETANMLITARLIIRQAIARRESVGTHYLQEDE